MDLPFKLFYSVKYTIQIFTLSLNISLTSADIDLTCLKKITGIVFIRDSQRGNMQFTKIVYKIMAAAHSEHFEYGQLGQIITILCPTISLCNPDRLPLFVKRIPYIFRSMHRINKYLFGSTTPNKFKHLVRFANVHN